MAHVVTEDMFADCLTKAGAKPDNLKEAIKAGVLRNCDKHPPFRSLMKNKHKAYFVLEAWMARNLAEPGEIMYFVGEPVRESMYTYMLENDWYSMP